MKILNKTPISLAWEDKIYYNTSYLNYNTFRFLNIDHYFKSDINWNFDEYGKLWTYNLNYFDFLNQKNISKDDGVALINSFIKLNESLKDGIEPYPISLRAINWIKFLSKNHIENHKINQVLYNHYQILYFNLEFHLLGNHLLENAFALFFGGIYFDDEIFTNKAVELLNFELNEQILNDGGHFELSPMYHQILLQRLLDCIHLTQQNKNKINFEFISFLQKKAMMMLSWLKIVTFRNGDIPMVNDSAYGIALSSKELFDYARRLNLDWREIDLLNSGYRKLLDTNFEVFIDIGQLAIDYQPGHAHADTFNFVMYVNDEPLIVDPAISTYEIGETRERERSTLYHNTVTVNDENSSQVWSGFRVAKRAKVDIHKDEPNEIIATNKNVKNLKHMRTFSLINGIFCIEDKIYSKKTAKACYHFHPNCKIDLHSRNKIKVDDIMLIFSNEKNIEVKDYEFAKGFNNRVIAKKVVVLFTESLKTEIKVISE